jgi:two-component system sensor histidine kinase HydH
MANDSVRTSRLKIFVLAVISALTVAIHYGWVLENFFDHAPWIHAVHSRFCYVPIAIAASWFGLRGGLLAATGISLLIIPYLLGASGHMVNLSQEFVEIFFYYSIGILVGALIDRELLMRRKQQETERQLERGHQLSMVGQMAAGVAHEIKNPLASIKGAMEILCDDETPKGDRDEFRVIVSDEIKRIDSTVTEFLEFGRPKETRLERLDLSTTVQSSLRQFEPQIGGAGLVVGGRIEGGVIVSGDSEKLRQVVLNLLLNSIEATAAGGRIDVNLKHTQDGHAELSVSDNGRGITPGYLDVIFEPFYTTKAKGTGLGLAVVRNIVESHRGTIGVTSASGQGTTFTITLPLLIGAQRA